MGVQVPPLAAARKVKIFLRERRLKEFSLRSLISIPLLLGVAVAINAQTVLAQPPPLPSPRLRAGSHSASSDSYFWFKQYCASCHGLYGTGDGPVASSLKVKPTDLTLLSKNNGGAFPEAEVRDFIDGTKIVAAHGSREMPVWGYPTTFQQSSLMRFFKPELTREEIDTRINLLVDYVRSIQKR